MKLLLILFLAVSILIGCSSKNEKPEKQKINQKEENSSQIYQITEKLEVKHDEKPSGEKIIPETIEGIWERYNSAKIKLKKAKEEGNFTGIKKNLLEAAVCAEKLGRKDIEAWQYNNIGYFSIEEFKKRTNYDESMKRISMLKTGEKKTNFLQAVKEGFRKEKTLIHDAKKYLIKAQKNDADLVDKKRKSMINSNLKFIENIDEFLNN